MQWNAASDDWHTTRATVDLRVGGAFCSRMEARDGSMGFDFEGVYTAVEPEQSHSEEMQRDGWQAILNRFKAFVEAEL